MADIRNFIMNSDYPTPFLVWKIEETLEVPVGEWYNAAHKSVAHNLPFTPLLIGQWSTTPYFVPAYDLSNEMPIFTGTRPDLQAVVGADATHIRITAEHTQESSVTFYFRIFAILPPSYQGSWANVLDDNTDFKLNSDFNLPKILASNTVTVQENQVVSYNHNLGYTPQVRAWEWVEGGPFDDYSEVWNILRPVSNDRNSTGLMGVRANDTTVEFGYQGLNVVGSTTYEYIIFGDEV